MSPTRPELVLSRFGGSKLSGAFSSVGIYRLTEAGLEVVAEDDLPAVSTLAFSPNGDRVAYASWSWGAAGGFTREFGEVQRFPPLPAHGETLGERLAAESGMSKGRVVAAGAADHASYAFEPKRGVCLPIDPAAPTLEWSSIKSTKACAVQANGRFVTLDGVGKVRAWDADGSKRWEAKFRGSTVVACSADGRLVYATHVLAGRNGRLLAVPVGVEGLCLAAAIIDDRLYAPVGDGVGVYSLADLA